MSKRTWNKKYTKKTSSQIIDEKIALLDCEMRKTKLGEAIVNGTSGLYQQGDLPIPQPNSWETLQQPTEPGPFGGYTVYANNNQFLYTDEDGNAYKRLDTKGVDNNNPNAYAIAFSRTFDVVFVGYIGPNGFNITGSSGIVYPYGEWGKYQELWMYYRDAMPTVGWVYRTSGFNQPRWFPIQAYVGDVNTKNKIPVRKSIDDPNFLPVLSRTRGNIKGTDPWEKLKDMFDAGKEWMDKMFGERLKTKQNEIKDLLKGLFDKSLKGLEGIIELGNEQIEKFVGDSFDKSIGTVSALQTLSAFWDHQEGRKSYTENSPYIVPYGQTQKQNIANALDNALNYTSNMGFDLRGKIDRGENFTQQEIDFLNGKMNVEFGSTTPEGFGYYRTFGKFSPQVKITKNNEGGYNIKDNYVFDSVNDFEGGEIEIGNVKITPATKGKYYAQKDKGDIDFYDKEPNVPGAQKIGSLKQMYITTSLPSVSKVKEQTTLDNLEKQLILDEMDYDILINKLSKLQEDKNSFNETKKSLKRVKQVVGK